MDEAGRDDNVDVDASEEDDEATARSGSPVVDPAVGVELEVAAALKKATGGNRRTGPAAERRRANMAKIVWKGGRWHL